MKRTFAFSMILVLLLLTACAGGKSQNPLAGSDWNLVTLGGTPPLEGTTLTLTFGTDQIGGNAGCNSFGGKYTVEGDKITISELLSTLMACTETGVMEQENAYLNAIGAAQSFSLKGSELRILSAEGVELVFARQE
jgi:heat shock protein HslJ